MLWGASRTLGTEQCRPRVHYVDVDCIDPAAQLRLALQRFAWPEGAWMLAFDRNSGETRAPLARSTLGRQHLFCFDSNEQGATMIPRSGPAPRLHVLAGTLLRVY
jgi:hypothetical protein